MLDPLNSDEPHEWADRLLSAEATGSLGPEAVIAETLVETIQMRPSPQKST